MIFSFSKRQWMTIIAMSIADFCNAICVSLQAPFYPHEAEKKGCTATEYGLVFGVFELVVFVISPLYGAHINKIGPRILFNGGILTTSTCAILFGLLDKLEGHLPFVILSFIIRIVEAMGNAAFLTASFSIIAKEFPENVATMFAFLETSFGLGLIVGPMVGGALYSVGGYTTPFAVMGSVLFLAAIMTYFALPKHEEPEEDSDGETSIIKLLKIPSAMLATLTIIISSTSIGFLQATLEPHLRQFGFSPIILGVLFIINGGIYAATAPAWGWICDRQNFNPKWISFLGCIFVSLGFLLVGPAPFISSKTTVWICISGLILHGLGMSCQLVSSFTDAMQIALNNGFSNGIDTYGMVSGLWTSTFALGAFIGPTVSGFLFDKIGFEWSTLFIFVLHTISGIVILLFIAFGKPTPTMYKNLDAEEEKNETEGTHMLGNGSLKSSRSIMAVSIEQSRPSGMNSLIACNSYKTRRGLWGRHACSSGRYCHSYGSVENDRYRRV